MSPQISRLPFAESGDACIHPNELQPTVVTDLPEPASIKDDEIFIVRNYESRYLTHLFHRFPGKFIPNIPRWAIKHVMEGKHGLILDPFAGSGTTLVEASLLGKRSIGVDIDPLATLIAKVKTTPISEKSLLKVVAEVGEQMQRGDAGSFRPSIPTLGHWFTERAIEDLSAIHGIIDKFREDRDIYDFLTVCFAAIIRKVSNADNQTMKTYVSHTHPKTPEPAGPLFERTVKIYADRLHRYSLLVPKGTRTVVLPPGDSQDFASTWKRFRLPAVDLVVTSPPYIKSVDYIYNQMAELFWIGDRWGLEIQSKQNVHKARYIGHDRPTAKRSETHHVGIKAIDQWTDLVHSQNPKSALVLHRYLCGMDRHFRSVRQLLKPGRPYVLIIGDSTLAGVQVPTKELLTTLAGQHGFSLVKRFGYEIRNKHMHFPRAGRGGHVVHDWVLHFNSVS